ncbi:gypsy type transposase [Tanacetum coccineum]
MVKISEASSSCSPSNDKKYDVFLSFRGEDTRLAFTSHLHKALKDANLRTFFDDEEIDTGWCLNELALILEQHRDFEHIVIPIFYHVDPSDVRKQQNSFGDAMEHYKKKMEEETNAEKKCEWALTLHKGTNTVNLIVGADLTIGLRRESNYTVDTVQLETAVLTITQEYLLEFTSEYGISEDLHPELPDRGDRIVDFPEGKIGISGWMSFSKRPGRNTPQCYMKPLYSLKNWNNRFFWVDERVFPTTVAWRTSAPKDSMPLEGTYSVEDVAILNARRTPIQKQPETLLCLVGLSRRYFLGDDVYPIFLHDDGREMDLFNLISAPNPVVIKTDTRPRTAHEVPLLTVIASRQIDMEEPTATSESSGAPSTIERSPLDFSNENLSEQINEVEEEETAADAPLVSKRRRKRANEESNVNAPRKVLRKDFDVSHPTQSTVRGKSLASIRLGASSTVFAPASQETPAGTINPDPISFVKPSSVPEQDIAQLYVSVLDLGLLRELPLREELVDHLAPPGYFSELRHLPNEEVLEQFNMTLAWQVAMESQLRLRFEQEAKLLRKSVAQVARRDQRIQAMEGEKKNLETLLEAEADMRKAAEAKNAELVKEMGSLRAQFTELQVSRDGQSHQVSTLQAQDLKYPLIDELEKLRDAPMDIPVYPEVRGPQDPWVVKEEMLQEDAIAANISSAEKKKKCRIVCRTHGVGSAHHARSDGVPVSVPTAVSHGLAILLDDAATQTDVPEEESSPKLTRSKSPPSM